MCRRRGADVDDVDAEVEQRVEVGDDLRTVLLGDPLGLARHGSATATSRTPGDAR